MASSNRRRQRALVLLALGLIAGCAQVTYERVHLDTPRPRATKGVPPCSGTLQENATCLALVRASQWFSETGLTVATGERYRISVPACQFWYDEGRLNVPPTGEAGSGLMNLFAKLKRHGESDWFSLIAAVLSPSGEPVEPVFDLGLSGADGVITPMAEGKLVMYPNDARSTNEDREYFYRNNHGQVWVMVTRCGPSCPSIAPTPDQPKATCFLRVGKVPKGS